MSDYRDLALEDAALDHVRLGADLKEWQRLAVLFRWMFLSTLDGYAASERQLKQARQSLRDLQERFMPEPPQPDTEFDGDLS